MEYTTTDFMVTNGNVTNDAFTTIQSIADVKEPKTGTIAGIIVVCAFLTISTIIGLIFYLKRRKSEVEPKREFTKETQDRTSDISTTWTEIDLSSNRSSGAKATDFEDNNVEMQPRTPFSLSAVQFSLYDDPDQDDETVNATNKASTSKSDIKQRVARIHSAPNLVSRREGEGPTLTKPADENEDEQGDYVDVIREKETKSLRIKEFQTKATDHVQGNNSKNTTHQEENTNNNQRESRPGGVSVNESVDEQDSDYEHVDISIAPIKSDKAAMDNQSKIEGNDSENSDESDADDIYVNVTLDRKRKHSIPDSTTNGNDETMIRHDKKEKGEYSTSQSSTNDTTREGKKSFKAPIPQPRTSIKNSDSKAVSLKTVNESKDTNKCDVDKDDTAQDISKDDDANSVDSGDSGLAHYDDVDQIYDVPKSNKRVVEVSEKL